MLIVSGPGQAQHHELDNPPLEQSDPLTPSAFSSGDISVEAFTALMIFKNMFSFALTWGAYDWIVKHGIVKIFNIIGGVQIVVCLLSIPMCKFRGLFKNQVDNGNPGLSN